MRTRLLPLSIAILLAATPALAAPKKFENDGNHTHLGFKASTTLFDVAGWFDKYNLLIEGDPAAPTSVRVKLEIDAKSINTNNKTRDNHLRSADFFDAKKYPKITFVSSTATREGNRIVLDGTLELRGVKKPFKIPFSHVVAKNGAGNEEHVFKADLTLNRKDFGLGADSVAAKISLADEIQVKLLVAGFFE